MRQIVEYYFVNDEEFIKTFKGHSAAKTVHHGFAGGLLEHTLSVVKFCEYMVGAYSILNKDLLYAAAICHDIGKTKELSPFQKTITPMTDSSSGTLLWGVEMISEAARNVPDCPAGLVSELKHCIIAHHGELEYGSPKKTGIGRSIGVEFRRR